MPCEAFRDLLNAYIDGQLDVVHGMEVERHLAECKVCARTCAEFKAMGGALRSLVPTFTPPPNLQETVRQALRRKGTATPDRPPGWRRPGSLLIAAALLGLLGFALWFLVLPILNKHPAVEGVVSSHVRSMMGDHLVDVKLADPAAVRLWFQGRLDFAPVVPPARGPLDALVGGRLDFLEGHPAAALVYRHREHLVTLMTWPETPGSSAIPVKQTHRGYNLLYWTSGGMEYWLVSDLTPTELLQFARLLGTIAPQGCH
jgi:anti-sigma factor RsiW